MGNASGFAEIADDSKTGSGTFDLRHLDHGKYPCSAEADPRGCRGLQRTRRSDWPLKPLWPFSDREFIYPIARWGDPGITLIFYSGKIAMAVGATDCSRLLYQHCSHC
jgi:hypothetical protein